MLGALGLGLAPVLIRRRGSSASVGALADDDEDDGSQLREQVTVKVPGMSSTVTAIQATADRKLTVVTKSGECGFWDPTADSFRAAQSKLPAFQVSALAQSAPRAIVASDHEVAVWDLSSWIKTPCPDDGASKIQSVAISPDGGRAVLGYGRSAIQVIDVVARKVTGELTGLSGQVTAMCVSDDGQQLLAGTGGGMVYLARFSPKLEKVAEAGGHSAAVRAVAAAPKCALFGSADDQGNVHVWSKDLKRVATAAACKAGVVSLCFVGKGELALAAGCADGTVKLVSPAGRVLASFSLGGSPVTAVSFSEPRAALAVGTADGKVALIGAE